MAGRLLGAGHVLTVWNRTTSKADSLVDRGAGLAATPADAVRDAEAVFVMVGDDDASRTVWTGEDGVLAGEPAPGALAVECSTLSRAWVAELAEHVRGRGLRHLDCPVTGLPDAAAAGKLTLLVGAEAADLVAARPLLEHLSTDVVHFGSVGAGTAYKLIINLMGAVQIASAAEGMVLAERAGLDLDQVARVMATGQAASPQVVRNARRMADGDHENDVVFSGRLRRKDAAYGLALAEALDHPAPFGRAALDGLDELLDLGLGEANESAVIDVARRLRLGHVPAGAEARSG